MTVLAHLPIAAMRLELCLRSSSSESFMTGTRACAVADTELTCACQLRHGEIEEE